MNFKRLLAVVLAMLLVVGLAACGGNETTTTAATTKAEAGETTTEAAGETTEGGAAGETVKVAFICADMGNPSQSYSSKQFEQYGADYGFEVTVLDAKAMFRQNHSWLQIHRSGHEGYFP